MNRSQKVKYFQYSLYVILFIITSLSFLPYNCTDRTFEQIQIALDNKTYSTIDDTTICWNGQPLDMRQCNCSGGILPIGTYDDTCVYSNESLPQHQCDIFLQVFQSACNDHEFSRFVSVFGIFILMFSAGDFCGLFKECQRKFNYFSLFLYIVGAVASIVSYSITSECTFSSWSNFQLAINLVAIVVGMLQQLSVIGEQNSESDGYIVAP